MERENNTYLRAICRGVAIAVSFILLYELVSAVMIIFAVAWESQLYSGLEPFIFCIAGSALSPLIFNSFALAFAYSDKTQIEEYMCRDDKAVTLGGELKRILRTPTLIAEILSAVLIILTASLLGAFYTFSYILPEGMPSLGSWFPAVTLTPICLISALLSKYEAVRFYRKLDKKHSLEEFKPTSWFIKRMLLLAPLYTLGWPLIPFGGMTVYTFTVTILSAFTSPSRLLSSILAVLFIVLLIFSIWGIKVLLRMSSRKKFFSRLSEIAEKNGYTVSPPENPYRSFATSKDQCTFRLELGGKQYNCLVISVLNRGTPLVFTSAADAYFLHQIGTKEHNISLRHRIEFLHAGEERKLIIVDPTPKKLLVEEDEKRKRLNTPDRIWGIEVYDTESFLGCVDRKCLGDTIEFTAFDIGK